MGVPKKPVMAEQWAQRFRSCMRFVYSGQSLITARESAESDRIGICESLAGNEAESGPTNFSMSWRTVSRKWRIIPGTG